MYRSAVPVRVASSAEVAGPSASSARYRPSRSPRYTVNSSSAPVTSRNSRSASAAAGSAGRPGPGREALPGAEHAAFAGAAQDGVPDAQQRVGGDDRGVGRAGDGDARAAPGREGVQLVAAVGKRLREPVAQGGEEPGLAHHHD